MNGWKSWIRWMALLAACLFFVTGCADGPGSEHRVPTGMPAAQTAEPESTEEPGPLEEAQRLADYLFQYGELPDTFLTKKEAKELGWQNGYRYVSDAAPGMSIGGDYFGNYERKLPVVKGRTYYEADCFYQGGPRNEYRIIYSSDGHVWYTDDHYETFTELFPSEDVTEAGDALW